MGLASPASKSLTACTNMPMDPEALRTSTLRTNYLQSNSKRIWRVESWMKLIWLINPNTYWMRTRSILNSKACKRISRCGRAIRHSSNPYWHRVKTCQIIWRISISKRITKHHSGREIIKFLTTIWQRKVRWRDKLKIRVIQSCRRGRSTWTRGKR